MEQLELFPAEKKKTVQDLINPPLPPIDLQYSPSLTLHSWGWTDDGDFYREVARYMAAPVSYIPQYYTAANSPTISIGAPVTIGSPVSVGSDIFIGTAIPSPTFTIEFALSPDPHISDDVYLSDDERQSLRAVDRAD